MREKKNQSNTIKINGEDVLYEDAKKNGVRRVYAKTV